MASDAFVAVKAEDDWLAQLAESDPTNPFCTAEYFRAMAKQGLDPWIVGATRYGRLLDGCGVFLRFGRLIRSLEIVSLPLIAQDPQFWTELWALCRAQRIAAISIGTFASPAFHIPTLPGETCRSSREEYVLDLRPGEIIGKMHSKHRYSVRKAQQAGLTIRRTTDTQNCADHVRLVEGAFERRRNRGELIADNAALDEIVGLIDSGAGELFQTMNGETVVSSGLVLRSKKGAYFQSTGTSPEGLAIGASHFLIYHIANELHRDGVLKFNLGGAAPDSTLARFKRRFGAEPVSLASVTCYIGETWRLKANTAIGLLRSNPGGLARALIGRVNCMIVYAHDTKHALPIQMGDGIEFRKLTESDIQDLALLDGDFYIRQVERLERYAQSFAYGVFIGGTLAHVSWLLPASAVRVEAPDLLCVRDDEAEITACETLPEYRGRRLYPLAIRSLIEVARSHGVRRVFMKTARSNRASRSGIETAGLKKVGFTLAVSLPANPSRPIAVRVFRR